MQILTAAAGADIGTLDALTVSLLGYAVVFFGLIALMCVTLLLGKVLRKKANAPQETVHTEVPAAPGSAGQLKLHDVEPKTAAMLMAITADRMGKPLNELRFLSIREVK